MYKTMADGVKRLADNACIPADEGNPDWIAYLEWLTKGNTPDPEYTDQELLDRARAAKREEILAGIAEAGREPLAAAGTFFPGGEEAMMELDREVRFARLLGLEECEVADVDGIDRLLPLAEAEELLKTMVAGWRAMAREKRKRLLDLGRASALEEIGEVPRGGFKDIIKIDPMKEGRK